MKYSACYILIRSPAQSNINHLSCNTQPAYKSVSTRQVCVPLFETLLQTIDLLENICCQLTAFIWNPSTNKLIYLVSTVY